MPQHDFVHNKSDIKKQGPELKSHQSKIKYVAMYEENGAWHN
jgi:hypothetical protein